MVPHCVSNDISEDITSLATTKEKAKDYHQISNIRDTQTQNLNVSCLVLQLYLPNPLKPGVKPRMRM